MTVIAVAGDDLVARLQRHLHADDDGFLADIEVAETADQAHAVHLPRLFLEAADGEHVAIGSELLLLAKFGHGSLMPWPLEPARLEASWADFAGTRRPWHS